MALSLEFNIVVLGVLILFSGFFSSIELAIFSISKIKMRRLVAENKKNAKLLSDMKQKPQALLTTILIGNNFVNVAAASIATVVSLEVFPSEIGIAVATGIITMAILIFGEITPKSLALKHNEYIALNTAPIIKIFALLFSPLVFILGKITGGFVRIFGGEKGGDVLTEDEVKTVISLGAEEGAIKKEEKEMIHRIFKLNDLMVEDVMTPRSEIESIESGTKIKDIDSKLLQEHSRIPVYKNDLDEILGIFHVRDLIALKGKYNSLTADKLMKPPQYVYANKKIDKLLSEFQKNKNHLVIAVDEYGGTIGLVTIEDILEEIVGEILDETDVLPIIKKISRNEFLTEGNVTLSELNKVIKSKLSSKEFDTVAGYVIGAMDKVPKANDEIVIGNIRFKVEQMDGPKIEMLRIFK